MPDRTDTSLPKPPAASAGECTHAGTSEEERVLAWIERLDTNVSVLTAGEAARLVDCLSGEHKPARRRAADALAAAMRAGAVSPQICERELDSTNPARRWGAAFALHRAGHGGSRIVDAALATLELDDGDMRWAALAIVVPAAREDENIRARLRDLAAAPGALGRKMALLCLCDSGEGDTSIYLRALGDPDALVRIAALTALGRLRDTAPRTLGALRRTCEHDEAQTVRRAAAAILERLGRHKG